MVKSGAVKIRINQTYPLRDAAQAHADLESQEDDGINGALALSDGASLAME